jgi:hypothetical protein
MNPPARGDNGATVTQGSEILGREERECGDRTKRANWLITDLTSKRLRAVLDEVRPFFPTPVKNLVDRRGLSIQMSYYHRFYWFAQALKYLGRNQQMRLLNVHRNRGVRRFYRCN